jgi:hypothetical protein
MFATVLELRYWLQAGAPQLPPPLSKMRLTALGVCIICDVCCQELPNLPGSAWFRYRGDTLLSIFCYGLPLLSWQLRWSCSEIVVKSQRWANAESTTLSTPHPPASIPMCQISRKLLIVSLLFHLILTYAPIELHLALTDLQRKSLLLEQLKSVWHFQIVMPLLRAVHLQN